MHYGHEYHKHERYHWQLAHIVRTYNRYMDYQQIASLSNGDTPEDNVSDEEDEDENSILLYPIPCFQVHIGFCTMLPSSFIDIYHTRLDWCLLMQSCKCNPFISIAL